MNRKTGLISSAVTLFAVLGFALSMLLKSETGSYISSMVIAWGFVPLICAFAAFGGKDRASVSYTAVAFAAVYAVFIMAVYFAQLTEVRSGGLSGEAARLIDYRTFGLFFSYDLLGYGFMALSTFFISFTLGVRDRRGKALGALLRIHGVFAVTCTIMPMLGLFSPGMAGGDLIGVLVLEFWCAYFTPVCILSYLYFKKLSPKQGAVSGGRQLEFKCALLAVRDVEASKRFYCGLFGRKIVLDLGKNVTFDGGFAIQEDFAWLLDLPESSVVQKSHNMELYFEVDDFDAFLQKLAGFDVRYVRPPMKHEWQQRVVRIYDPDWHIIEIGESMAVIARRFLAEGYSVRETAEMIQHPAEFVEKCKAGNQIKSED